MKKLLLLWLLLTSSVFAVVHIDNFVNKDNCDQVLDNKYYKVCYDYKLRGPIYVGYRIDGETAHLVGQKKRFGFRL